MDLVLWTNGTVGAKIRSTSYYNDMFSLTDRTQARADETGEKPVNTPRGVSDFQAMRLASNRFRLKAEADSFYN